MGRDLERMREEEENLEEPRKTDIEGVDVAYCGRL